MVVSEEQKGGRPRRRKGLVPDVETYRDWVLVNPLWRWREDNQVTRPMAAAMLGVNSTSIWQWEHGAVRPKAENMTRLVEVLGPDTVERWAHWLAAKPKVV